MFGIRVRVRFEFRVRLILFICTTVVKNVNRKWLPCGIFALCCIFNKVLKVYEVDKFQNICLVYH